MGDLLTLTRLTDPGATRKGLRRATPAATWYELGVSLETTDPAAAGHAYERAIAGRPDFADAHNNLGRLLHDRSDFARAESHYRLALCSNSAIALYWFNLGVVVEDRGRTSEAIAAYERALDLDPDLADAHYNLARLYELTARRTRNELELRSAIRHLTRYRNLARTRLGITGHRR